MPSSSSSSNDDSNQTNKSEMENNNNNKCSGDSPSPASSSVSLTSTSNSIDTQPTPSVPQQHQQHHNLNQNHHHLLITNNKSEPHQFLNKLNHQYMNNSNNSSNNTNNTLSPSRCTFMTSSTNGQQTNGGNYMSLSQHQQANARYLNHQQQQQTTSINHLFVNNPKSNVAYWAFFGTLHCDEYLENYFKYDLKMSTFIKTKFMVNSKFRRFRN